MSRSVELVLAFEAAATSHWIEAPGVSDQRRTNPREAGKRARRRGRSSGPSVHADIGVAIGHALSRMPDIVELCPAQASTVRAFVDPDGARRVISTVAGEDTPYVKVVHTNALVPGVWQCETVCDERLKDERLCNEQSKPGIAPALSARRGVWRWTAPDGASVDIELHDVRPISSDAPPSPAAAPAQQVRRALRAPRLSQEWTAHPAAFCELRLVARVDPGHASAEGPASTRSTSTSTVERVQAYVSEVAFAPIERESSALMDPIAAALRALFAAAGVLADVLPVFPTLSDGYARIGTSARADAPVRAAHIDVSRTNRPHAALISLCSSITLQWFGNDAGVRNRAGAEFVHQMRVALRRLKTLSKIFPRWIDDTWTRTIAPDLDWLAVLLGQARDLDVFVDATLPALAAADTAGATASWSSLHARAAARREEAHAHLAAALRTRRYALLSLRWLRWLAMQRVSPGPLAMAEKSLADYAAKRVRKHHRRLLGKPRLMSLSPAQRHRRRIEAKRLRYTLEFFASLASRKTRRKVSKQLGRIQNVLGDGSDAATALRFLEALDVPPYEHGFARGWCEAVNRWSAIEGERLLRALHQPKIVRAS